MHSVFDKQFQLIVPRRFAITCCAFLIAAILSVLSAYRFLGIDKDYAQYLYFYRNLSVGYSGRFEVGFVLLSLFAKEIFDSFSALLFFSSFVSLSAKYYLISKLPNWYFWGLLYFFALYPLHELTQIRVSVALGFGYLSIYFSNIRGITAKSLLFFALAVSFHWTLLFFSPFVFFNKYFQRVDLKFLCFSIFVPSVVLFLCVGSFSYLNPQVSHIISLAGEEQANPVSSRNIIMLIVIAIGIFNLKSLHRRVLPWFYLSVSGISTWYGLMSIPVFAHRILELTIFSYFFWIPCLPRLSRFLCMVLFALLSAYLFLDAIYLNPLFGKSLW